MEALGIDLFTLIVQIVNFVILLFILKKVLYKPLLKAISERQKMLTSIETREKSIGILEATSEQKRKELLKSAQEEGVNLLKEAEFKAEEKRKAIIDKANIEAKDLIKKASAEADKIEKITKKEMEEKILNLSSIMVRKILSETLDENVKQASVKKAVEKLKTIRV